MSYIALRGRSVLFGSVLAGLLAAACGGAEAPVEAPSDVTEEELVSFHGVSARDIDTTLPEVDTIGYDVALVYRGEEARTVSGREIRTPVFTAEVTVSYVATQPLTSLTVDFKNPHLGRVAQGSRTLAFSQLDADHVKVELGRTVRAGTGLKLTFGYEVLSREIDERESEDGGLVVTPTLIYSASWPRKGRWWLPLRDSPRDGAMFAAKVTFPAEYTVVSNGVAKGTKDEASGAKTWSFELLSPTPTYGFFVGASKEWVRADARAASGVPMPSWVDKAHVSKRQAVLGDTPKALDFLESTYGKFPFSQAGFVEAPTTWGGGGMEHATVVAIDPRTFGGDTEEAQSTAIHELCHHYSGDGVRIATWADFWMSEGFTEYLTLRSVEAVYGKARSDAAWAETIRNAKAQASLHALRPKNDAIDVREIFDGVAYVKGAWVLRVIENKVGRAAFDAFLKAWFAKNLYRAVTSDMLKTALEASFGKTWDTLFESAVYGTALPE